MSTRSCLAYKTKTGFEGVYCHWDGYPTNRGAQIWDLLMDKFILNKGKIGVSNDGSKAIQSFIDIYIKGHKGGWSSFPTECHCHSPEFVMRDGFHEETMTDKTADALFIEWVYVIDSKNKKMEIYIVARTEGETEETSPDGKRKWKTPNYKHYLVCVCDIDPDKAIPNWEFVEATGHKIREEMYKKYKEEGVKNV